jgi:hypothetical protein
LNVSVTSDADTLWAALDNAWHVAFAQAWAALRAGTALYEELVAPGDERRAR